MAKRTVFLMIFVVFMFVLNSCNGEERQRPVLQYGTNNPADTGSRYPYLFSEDGETLHMSWLGRIEEDIFTLEYSIMRDGRWLAPTPVHVGNNFFVNWADFPSIVTYENNPVALHWLKKIEGGPYAYDVQISFPGDEPRRWNHITPHTDGTATEHGFVSMLPIDGERVLAIWLDGRHTEHREHDEYTDFDQAMTLRSAVIHRDGTLEDERVIDDTVCDCCQTDLVAVDGGAIVVYRDRTEGEIRDISLSFYDFETTEWSDPVTVHDDGWQINGCPVNGPRAAVNDHQLAVVWFTEVDDEPKVQVAFSDNNGQTFGEPVLVSSGNTIGRVDIAAGKDNEFYVSWMDRGENLADIRLAKVSPDGVEGEVVRVGGTANDRNSGFPRLAALNEGIVLAWTQTEPFHRVRTALVLYPGEAEVIL